ncbi:family 65 glycosyl hydrolase domain-containing protein [Pedobacter cryotolerans]|uniref:Glycoside hydrolase family 65 protein n=1 Tax=Pedobacter cryotolerans TaxID=2571270 RepID=A0A4U1C096_9SPHI|nr:family 65 glycosyl hydrolase domain-containing protein [Pedobacter cryotolerans]TKB98278.1 glycoside hydrolase family 65 protein [Pedobacter cryotolerans]
MKNYIKHNEWQIIEKGFDPHLNKISESIFSIGNGRMGQRANFEETYTGETLQGNYVAGVYYPDKTRVGWWKNGYPEYFAKVLNATNWIGLNITISGEVLDLNTSKVSEFTRVLDMKLGTLTRKFTVELANGNILKVEAIRFCSIVDDEAGVIKYSITPQNFDGKITVESSLDGDVKNQDSNYDEKFWNEITAKQEGDFALLTLETKKTAFWVSSAIYTAIFQDGNDLELSSSFANKEKYVSQNFEVDVKQNEAITIFKYAVNLSSENHEKDAIEVNAISKLKEVVAKGFKQMLAEQAAAWAAKWQNGDVIIECDVAAQQAIRFNIFQLHQTYTGEDARLNIGPKGFTGEKYGGSTYWDTEAYCLPFYLATAPQQVAENLLIYRYKHLEKAIENAEKLGFKNGAALYPMVTINGEECHNEWEITFEEIHRNGAIAFAIFNYIRYTGENKYLAEYGLEVLIGIARFWAQRVNWSIDKEKYVMLGVTGPNEYENNINNNWYTSTIATWCLKYTIEAIETVKQNDGSRLDEIVAKTKFNLVEEQKHWQDIIEKMFYPEDEKLGIFLQQDGYLDKEQVLVAALPAEDRPLNQKWSWDRILRSCFIKQADVLQGIYFFEEDYDLETIRRNYDFYEPRTVHESSLSPCVHAIIAAKLGDLDRAYEFYLRTSRLDLDDYNNDTEDGLHITSMAGTWLSVVEGFGGMRVKNNQLSLHPVLPKNWKSYSFKIGFRKAIVTVKFDGKKVSLSNESEQALNLNVFGKDEHLEANGTLEINS